MTNILAFEGIDSCGKQTQADLLARHLRAQGFLVDVVSYPAYTGFIGSEIGKLLNGTEGRTMLDLSPKTAALWYATDRVEDFSKKAYALSSMDYVIFNRWTMSNKAFQAVRSDNPQAMIEWIDQLEHIVFCLPRPTAYILLHISPEKARELTSLKGDRIYTSVADVHERNMPYQLAVNNMYGYVAEHQKERTLMIPPGGVSEVHSYVLENLMRENLIPKFETNPVFGT